MERIDNVCERFEVLGQQTGVIRIAFNQGIAMKQLVVGLMFVGSLCIGAAIQAQERSRAVVSVECNGSCAGSTLGQLCRDLAGPTFRPIAVDCANVMEQSPSVPCGGNNVCSGKRLSPEDQLSAYCDDTSGWDAQVYCEDVTRLPVQKAYPGMMCQPFTPQTAIQYNDDGGVTNVIATPNSVLVRCPVVRDSAVVGLLLVRVRISGANFCTLESRGIEGNLIASIVGFRSGGPIETVSFAPISSVSEGYVYFSCFISPQVRLISYQVFEFQTTTDSSLSDQNELMGQISDSAK